MKRVAANQAPAVDGGMTFLSGVVRGLHPVTGSLKLPKLRIPMPDRLPTKQGKA